ncbi:MAG: hypothetical protein DRR16_29130 [Candidatus Parabeggiatoa sp. nov. 3]|nr:MAG: hypothetical protein DRR00_16940 [Gammaproteobacteria bacterium]RKZ65320.1 MAG: hypothetical protein DRQ99_12995 [Gammaproteobacteria bacterium]RKZ77712.1 MAG: hypothetical protein DRR16_29130 [Gammaproteobacteria bacterium]
MAFRDYKHISQVQQEFQIIAQEERFIIPQDVELPPQFVQEFSFNQQYFDLYASEGSRTELIISPFIREVYKTYAQDYELWVQKSLHCDDKLQGTPDYILATRSELGKRVLAKPLLVMVEAKRNDFEEGWGQCLAELIAAQTLNKAPSRPVYGIVTDGKRWEFGKLVQKLFSENVEAYPIEQVQHLYSALHSLFHLATTAGNETSAS